MPAHGLRSLDRLIEDAVRQDVPSWRMQDAAARFSLENGRKLLESAFSSVALERPEPAMNPPFCIRDPTIVSDYVESLSDPFEQETGCPWRAVVGRVRAAVEAVIGRTGGFTVQGDPGAFTCR